MKMKRKLGKLVCLRRKFLEKEVVDIKERIMFVNRSFFVVIVLELGNDYE